MPRRSLFRLLAAACMVGAVAVQLVVATPGCAEELHEQTVPILEDPGGTSVRDFGVLEGERLLYSGLSSYWSLIRLEKRLWSIQRRFNIFVSDRRILLDRWILDRIVLEPTTLTPETQLSLSRTYRDWYGWLVKLQVRYATRDLSVRQPFYRWEWTGVGSWKDRLALHGELAREVLQRFVDEWNANMDDEALWDYGVYFLGESTGLRTDWDAVLSALVASEWTAASAVFLATSLSDEGKIGTITRLWEDPNGLRRVGARVDLTNFGISLQPTFRTGLVLETPEYTTNLVWENDWTDVQGSTRQRGTMELSISRERVYRRLAATLYLARFAWHSSLELALDPNSVETPWTTAQSHGIDFLLENKESGISPRLSFRVDLADREVSSAQLRLSYQSLYAGFSRLGNWSVPAFEVFGEVGRGTTMLSQTVDESEWYGVLGLGVLY